ncbi:hypothetical protein HYH03_009463 [Edaphochlamys debaryana]|uniref:Uncharacterized protein n=1 Tax=Edaphochlamys debaryana TaxID=47281 RepID=A0A835Y066_9CHLO|nr:hypothetical protein HYH03_009463 [Edaphochlamys debaryana]|eukprot:KAG2492218.1 hypothetical protein HYH03_009463 [Edaphochlamys debaryana]
MGFLKKAEPPTPSLGSEALDLAKNVTPFFAIVGTCASLLLAWNTLVVQPNKAQFEAQQEQLQELRAAQQEQLALLTRLEQLLGPLQPLPERLAVR